MSHPLEGYRVVSQPDGRMAFYRPDGTFHGYGRRLPKSSGGTAPKRQRGRATMAVKRTATAGVGRPAPPPRRPSTGRYMVVMGVRHVDREVRRAAQEAADICADDLGIKRRDVRWFDDATPARLLEIERRGLSAERFDAEDCLGIFRPEDPNAIYVKVTSDPRLAAEVAAHETAHRAQFLARGRPQDSELEAFEAEAHQYSDSFAAWMDQQGDLAS